MLDASAIDQPDGSFDVVACRMGLMFTLDPAVALGEIRRVLRTRGRFGALTWAGIEHNPWMTCVGMAAMMNGLVNGGPPDRPRRHLLPRRSAELRSARRGRGFRRCGGRRSTNHVPRREHRRAHRTGQLAGRSARRGIRAATPEQLAAVRRTAADLAAPYSSAEGLVLPGRAILLTANTAADTN